MEDQENTIHEAASKPQPVFLVLASLVSMGAMAIYFYKPEITERSGEVGFAFLLVFLVLGALFLVLCYRMPRVGNKMLGFSIVIDEPEKKINEGYHYTGTFKVETGADEKRQNSKRKQARYNRRKIAALTREMQKEGLLEVDEQAPPDEDNIVEKDQL